MNSKTMLLPTIVMAALCTVGIFLDSPTRIRIAIIFFTVVFWLGAYAHYKNIKKNNGKLL